MRRVIYFDWDGTLCSKQVSEEANIRRTKFFLENVDEDKLIEMQHNNDNNHYGFIKEVISNDVGIKPEHKFATMLQTSFFGYNYLKVLQENEQDKFLLFDREEVLNFKKEFDLKFVIVTSLTQNIVENVVDILGLNLIFDGVYGTDDYLIKTKSENLKQAISDNEEDESLIMIGDRGEDIEAGKVNNLKTIFCNYGHGQTNEANLSIENSSELLDSIRELI